MQLKEKIQKIVEPLCEELQLRLVELDVQGGARNPAINIFADSEQGITLGQCSELTRLIQDELDLDDAIRENYRLNVSSPGLDRLLKEDWEFRKNMGKELRVQYREEGKSPEVVGTLDTFDENNLNLKIKGQLLAVPRDRVIRAKIKLQW